MAKRGRPRKHHDLQTTWRMNKRRQRRAARPVTTRTLRRRAQRAAQSAQPTEAHWMITPTVQVLCQDLRCITDVEVPPQSLDVILTDPPYDGQALPLYAALGAFAARCLRPGGSLLVLCGQYFLPEVLAALSGHLRYQ